MCGFAGGAGAPSWPAGDHVLLRAMGDILSARGPDGESIHVQDGFRVVFRRLAINDLAGGDQPFCSPDGRLVVVVNGEIYNHADLARQHLPGRRFRSRSDCEVVLHLFEVLGTALFAELNGMFSIAVWDAVDRRLVLARDRLGIKPLYYAEIPGQILFASELRALLCHPQVPRSLDWSALREVPDLTFAYQRPAGRAISSGIKGVELVRPGCFVEWRAGSQATTTRYWELVGPTEASSATSAEPWVERYADLLTDSVRLRLMSDVPVGVFLSGGVDSALVTALAVRQGIALEAFTLVEPSITAAGEPAAAQAVADLLGLPLHLVRVDAAALDAAIGLGLETLEHLVSIMDFPVFDPEILFKHELHRYVAATRPDMKVILLGQGADEFAGGYSRLGPASWAEWVDGESRALRRARARQLGISPAFAQLVSARVAEEYKPELPAAVPVWQAARLGDLPAHNLWHEDRTAAASGRESRVPFLDHRIVELLCSIPVALHEQLFDDKRIERMVARRFLPAAVTERPKVGLYGTRRASIHLVRARLVEASFEAYREKYLRSDDALFDEDQLVQLYAQVIRTGAAGRSADLLVRCMAISIFERAARSAVNHAPRRLTCRPCPLRLTESAHDAGPVAGERAMFRLSPGVVAAVVSHPRHELLLVGGDAVLARVELGPQSSAQHVDRFVRAELVDPGQMAAMVGVTEDEVQPVLEVFLTRHWLEPVALPEPVVAMTPP